MNKKLVTLIAATIYVAGCSSENSSPANSVDGGKATKPATILAELSAKTQTAGEAIGNAVLKEQVGTSSLFTKLLKAGGPIALNSRADEYCNYDGQPYAVDLVTYTPITAVGSDCASNHGSDNGQGECIMSESHREFAGNSAFCLLSKDTGNSSSVLGTFTQLKSIMCAFEKANVTWHTSKPSAPQAAKLSFDKDCFDEVSLSHICGNPNGCSPEANVMAYLNPDNYYNARVSMQIEIKDKTIQYDAKIKTDNNITEIAVSSQGNNGEGQYDAYAVRYDAAKNAYTFEGRFDRIDLVEGDGNGGWSRHVRI